MSRITKKQLVEGSEEPKKGTKNLTYRPLDSSIRRVEIIKQPKQGNAVAWIALIVSVISSLFVSYNYFVLERANIGIENFEINLRQEENGNEYFEIRYNLHNYGKSTAKNLRFEIYAIPLEGEGVGQQLWSEEIDNPVPPQTSILPFGRDWIPANIDTEVVWVFDITYNDTIWGERNNQLWFKYTVGAAYVHTLIKSEKEKIWGKYQDLKNKS